MERIKVRAKVTGTAMAKVTLIINKDTKEIIGLVDIDEVDDIEDIEIISILD